MKLDFISIDQKPNCRACNGSTHDLLLSKFHVTSLSWKALVDSVLGLPRA